MWSGHVSHTAQHSKKSIVVYEIYLIIFAQSILPLNHESFQKKMQHRFTYKVVFVSFIGIQDTKHLMSTGNTRASGMGASDFKFLVKLCSDTNDFRWLQ